MSFSFSLLGTDALEKRLKDYSKKIQNRVEEEIEATAQDIRAKAVRRVPVNLSTLKQGITIRPVSKGVWEVASNANYSAYVEFGTGVYAASYVPTLPKEIQEYARQFYVNGKGTIPARPFLFNSFLEERVQLVKRIKEIIKNG